MDERSNTRFRVKQESTVSRTFLAYDPALLKHKPWLPHQRGEPEVPTRVENVMRRLNRARLDTRCRRSSGRDAKGEEILQVHTPRHLQWVKDLRNITADTAKVLEEAHDSIYVSKDTYTSSVRAAGCAIDATMSVVSGECSNAVAVVRPPGHHAFADAPSGFCFLNNVAIATKQAKLAGVSRILIVDWDVHHGNGTQSLFVDDPNVLFISLHRYDNAEFYPHSDKAHPRMVGEGNGVGFNVNVAWNSAKLQDKDYQYAFQQVVLPIAKEFNPELILVSAGFDAAEKDPLGNCCLQPRIFFHMTRWLQGLANGKVVLVLEGGYNVDSVANCMVACVQALLGDAPPSSLAKCKGALTAGTIESVALTRMCHKPYWRTLASDGKLASSAQPAVTETLPKRIGICEPAKDSKEEEEEISMEGGTNKGKKEEEPGAEDQAVVALSRVAAAMDLAGPASDTAATADATAADATAADAITDVVAATTASSTACPAVADSTPIATTTGTAISTDASSLVSDMLGKMSLEGSATASKAYTAKKQVTLTVEDCTDGVHPTAQGFVVVLKKDCPHTVALSLTVPEPLNLGQACERCDETYENWICLTCNAIACGRGVNQHMVRHNQRNSNHHLVLSFADLSLWCYACDSYIEWDKHTQDMVDAVHLARHGVAVKGASAM